MQLLNVLLQSANLVVLFPQALEERLNPRLCHLYMLLPHLIYNWTRGVRTFAFRHCLQAVLGTRACADDREASALTRPLAAQLLRIRPNPAQQLAEPFDVRGVPLLGATPRHGLRLSRKTAYSILSPSPSGYSSPITTKIMLHSSGTRALRQKP